MRIHTKLVTIFASVAIAFAANAAPVLVGNSDLAGASLSDSDVEALLLGKMVSLNGKRVVIVLAKSSEGQEEFLKSKVGKTDSQFNAHWRRLFMTGGGIAPTSVGNDAEVASKVASSSGAVGIVDESAAGDLVILAR